jgi:hypothetical protein
METTPSGTSHIHPSVSSNSRAMGGEEPKRDQLEELFNRIHGADAQLRGALELPAPAPSLISDNIWLRWTSPGPGPSAPSVADGRWRGQAPLHNTSPYLPRRARPALCLPSHSSALLVTLW